MAIGFPELQDRPAVRHVEYARSKEALPPRQLRKRDVFWMSFLGMCAWNAVMWVLVLGSLVLARFGASL